MTCEEAIYSENVYDYITDYPIENTGDLSPVFCYAGVGNYNIAYVDKSAAPDPEKVFFDYPNMPMLYGIVDGEGAPGSYLFDPRSIRETGSLSLQQGSLGLTGRGVTICFIDTGIDYRNPAFRLPSGETRIAAIWDQSLAGGKKPAGFWYGTEFTREEINRALISDTPYELVPHRDISGHGTALASVAAGSQLLSPVFRGAAPEVDIVAVKLKPAKEYLRSYYLVPDGVMAYQENDIMLAVEYCQKFAVLLKKPIVICIGLGSNLGSHKGRDFLSEYLNAVAVKRSRGIVIPGGSEGGTAHHFFGDSREGRSVELNVEENNKGFFLELWGQLPGLVTLTLTSPGGESLPKIRLSDNRSVTYGFVFEKTQVTVDSSLVEPGSGDQLIRLRFLNPTRGIWSLRVEPVGEMGNGYFDLWLPGTTFLNTPVNFLRPNPDTTLTAPGYSENVLTVTYYDDRNGALAPGAGRGYSRNGSIKPDFAAPGVEVSTVRGPITGSGVAAALTAGAVAQFFQWAVVDGNNRYVETREIRSYFILGATRRENQSYPNREWGYGRLNLRDVFTILAGS